MDTYTDAQLQAYNALRVAAERMANNIYRNGGNMVQMKKLHGQPYSYIITDPNHRRIVETMPKVLSGEVSVNDCMAMLHEYDIMKLRFQS